MTINNFLKSSPQNFIPIKSLPTLSDGMTIGNAFNQMREKGVPLSLHKGPGHYVILTPQAIIKHCQATGACSKSDIIDKVAAAQKPLVVMQVSQPARILEEFLKQKKVVALASAGDIVGLMVPIATSFSFAPGDPGLPGKPKFIPIELKCQNCDDCLPMFVFVYDENNPPMCSTHQCPMVPR